MSNKTTNPCPCHSGLPYDSCCKPFHDGILPGNALLLMRSRYAAYALGKADYLIDTTHPANPQYSENRPVWKERNSQFSRRTNFINLAILDFQDNNETATVTFTAYLTQNGKDASFTEKSTFEKVNGRWLYLSGEIFKIRNS